MLYQGKKNIWRANDANDNKGDDFCLPAPSLLCSVYDYCRDLQDAYQQKYSREPASKTRISGSIEDEKIFLSQNARKKQASTHLAPTTITLKAKIVQAALVNTVHVNLKVTNGPLTPAKKDTAPRIAWRINQIVRNRLRSGGVMLSCCLSMAIRRVRGEIKICLFAVIPNSDDARYQGARHNNYLVRRKVLVKNRKSTKWNTGNKLRNQ